MGVIKQIWIYIVLTCMLITSAQALSTQTFQIHEGSNEFVLNLNPTIVSEIDKQKIINNLDTYKQKQVITDYIEREDLIKIIFNPLVEIEEIKISKKMIKIRERPDGYIIELNTPPIIVHKKELENEIIQYHQMQLIHEKQHQQNNFITPSQNFNDSAEIKINYANYNKIYNEFISSYVLAEQISIAKENQRELITSNFNTIKNLTKTLEQQDSRGIIATIGSLVNRKQKEITPEPQFTNEFYYTFAGITVRNISPEKIETIKNLDFVKNVHPNYRVRVALDASVPVIQDGIPAGFVGHNGENCNETDQPCLTGEGITIAIIDTGVDYTHPDLGECTQQQFLNENCEKVIGGYDFVNNNQDSFDDQGHGTHVAAIAAGNGYFKGVAPNARILAYKVLDESGGGFMSDIISGIEEAVLDGADILSLSLGGFGDPDDPVSISADNAVLDGKVVVVAAGNDGEYGYQTIGSPGTARKVITVGAIDNDLRMAEFSSKGPVVWEGGYLFKPDIVAPGVEICAAKSSEDKIRDLILTNEQREVHCTENNQHISISGTSMATPHVSGAIALLLEKKSELTPPEIKSIVSLTAKDLGHNVHEQGAGMINVTRMLQSSLVITGDLSFIIHETDVYEKNLILKNIGDETIHITITTTNAQNENGDEINVLTVNESVISINPHNTKEISFTLNISEISNDELYVGSVLFQSETDEYRIPYIFDINSELNVKFPNHTPNFIVFDDSLDNWYVNNQYQIGGSSSVFRLKSGNYTVIAVNDFLSQGPIKKNEYIIAKRVEVPFRGVSNVTFNLSDAREFVFEGKSLRGSELKIYDWTKGFAIYSSTNEECNLLSSQGREVCEESPEEHTCRHIPDSNYEYDCIAKGRMYTWGESGSPVALGDRKVYLNNNPSYNAGISIDILAQYMGGIHE